MVYKQTGFAKQNKWSISNNVILKYQWYKEHKKIVHLSYCNKSFKDCLLTLTINVVHAQYYYEIYAPIHLLIIKQTEIFISHVG